MFTSIPLDDIIYFLSKNNQPIPLNINDSYVSALKLIGSNTRPFIPNNPSDLLINYESSNMPNSIIDWITIYNLAISNIISGKHLSFPIRNASTILTSDDRDLQKLADSLSLQSVNKERIIRKLSYMNRLNNDMNVFDILSADILTYILSSLDYKTISIMRKISLKFYKYNMTAVFQIYLRRMTKTNINEYDTKQLIRLTKILNHSNTNIIASFNHSAILTNDHRAYTFGDNERGQLGYDGDNKHIPTLQKNNIKPIQISSGRDHSLLLTDSGDVYMYGYMPDDDIGIKNMKLIHKFTDKTPFNIVQVSARYNHSLMLTDRGQVYSFGDNANGQLGLGNYKNTCEPVLIPKLIEYGNNSTNEVEYNVIQISAGNCFSLLLSENGQVFICGYVESSVMSNDIGCITIPTCIPSLDHKIVQIAAGNNNSLLLTDTGTVYVLDNNNIDGKYMQLNNICNIISCSISLTNDGTLLLRDDGRVYIFNEYIERFSRSGNIMENITDVIQISAGNSHSLLLTRDGKVHSVGGNAYGQLGLGNYQYHNNPKFVMSLNI